MRQKHLKFHATAIAAICGIIIVLFMLFGPKGTSTTDEVVGDRYITIDNATWGKNCDMYVRQALASYIPPAPGTADAPPKPAYAQYNNALPALREQCDHHLKCSFMLNSANLKVDPLPSCFKRLTVGYRCFSYDRLHKAELGQGEMLTIDCHEGAAEPASTPQ